LTLPFGLSYIIFARISAQRYSHRGCSCQKIPQSAPGLYSPRRESSLETPPVVVAAQLSRASGRSVIRIGTSLVKDHHRQCLAIIHLAQEYRKETPSHICNTVLARISAEREFILTLSSRTALCHIHTHLPRPKRPARHSFSCLRNTIFRELARSAIHILTTLARIRSNQRISLHPAADFRYISSQLLRSTCGGARSILGDIRTRSVPYITTLVLPLDLSFVFWVELNTPSHPDLVLRSSLNSASDLPSSLRYSDSVLASSLRYSDSVLASSLRQSVPILASSPNQSISQLQLHQGIPDPFFFLHQLILVPVFYSHHGSLL
jgi:hypothetical protein